MDTTFCSSFKWLKCINVPSGYISKCNTVLGDFPANNRIKPTFPVLSCGLLWAEGSSCQALVRRAFTPEVHPTNHPFSINRLLGQSDKTCATCLCKCQRCAKMSTSWGKTSCLFYTARVCSPVCYPGACWGICRMSPVQCPHHQCLQAGSGAWTSKSLRPFPLSSSLLHVPCQSVVFHVFHYPAVTFLSCSPA